MDENSNLYKEYYKAREECEKIFLQDFANDFIGFSITLMFTNGKRRVVTKQVPVKNLDGVSVIQFKYVLDGPLESLDVLLHGFVELKYHDSTETFAIVLESDTVCAKIYFHSDNEFADLILDSKYCVTFLDWTNFPNTFHSLFAKYKMEHQHMTLKEIAQFE